MAYLTLLGALGALLLVADCSPSPAASPEAWQEYDSLAALQDDASLVVTGVAQRHTATGETRDVQFSITEVHTGAAPAHDPVLVRLDSEVPLDLQAGFQYVLYLTAADDDTYTVVGPGAYERAPGSPNYERPTGAPDTLPRTVTSADLDAG